MTLANIIKRLPYRSPFLFVDALTEISEEGVCGNYRFREDEYFYEGHFKNKPVTPGVILTETMAQIGLVCLGIYLMGNTAEAVTSPELVLSSTDVEFLVPVLPGEKVTVRSTKNYFRFNKLSCRVEMRNEEGTLVCRGTIAGFLLNRK